MYQLSHAQNIVINTQDGSSFDVTSGHPFALAYLMWLGEGNTPEPALIVNAIPTEVSMSQAREALLQAGLLAAVNSAVSQLSEKAQIQWEYRATVKRDNEFVQELITNGLLTNTQLDALFTLTTTL